MENWKNDYSNCRLSTTAAAAAAAAAAAST